ncbi:hypothetical protein [Parasphingorhabdus sp.]|uniref:hypothetical protein n=1 Tax=Parasphingorhabdus sp. TaxID=2709688 RepID=UPI003D2DDB82
MIYLFVFFAAIAFFLFLKGVPTFRFDQFSTLSWLFSTFLGSTGLIVHKTPLAFETIILVMICHGVMLIGFSFAQRHTVVKPSSKIVDQLALNLISLLPVIFILFAMLRSAIEGNIPILSASSNIEISRDMHWEEGKSGLDRLIQIFVYTSLPFLVVYPVLKKTSYLTVIYAMSLMFAIDNALLEGGRALIIFIVISVVTVLFTVRKIRIGRIAIYSTLGLLMIYILGSQFYLARNTNFASNADRFIRYNCNGGTMAEPVKEMPVSIQSLTLSSCYFSTPLSNFDRMRRDWNKTYNGAYNGGIVFTEGFVEAREDIANYFASRRLAPNGWSTSVRDIWLDVGYAVPLAFLIIGFVAAKIGKLGPKNSPGKLARYGLLGTVAFMMPYQSPFILRYVIYPVVFTYLIEIFVRLLVPFLRSKTPKRVKVQRRPQRNFR